MLILRNIWATVLTLSIGYLHLNQNLKTGITSKENFNSPIIYITTLHKFHMQFLKSGRKYWDKAEQRLSSRFPMKLRFLIPMMPNEITTIIQRWNSSNVKLKDKTICNDFQNGDLKNVGISNKISRLQCSWVKKLYD